MKLLNSLSEWFADLQPRERLIITVGAALLNVAAIYMMLLPAMQKNAALEQRHKNLVEDIQWLREQSRVVSGLNSGCAGQTIQSASKKEVITKILRRNQLKLLGLDQIDSNVFSLTASGSSPNRILQFIHQLACQGLVFQALDVRSYVDVKVAYTVDLEVSYVD